MKRTARLIDALSMLAVVWLGGIVLPLSTLWFDPQFVVVSDGPRSESPDIGFAREIKRPVKMRYSVIVRNADLQTVCESRSEVFWYKPEANLPENIDLDWWTAGDCPTLPVGLYIMETCWTATELLWGLLPDKTACLASNPFKVW